MSKRGRTFPLYRTIPEIRETRAPRIRVDNIAAQLPNVVRAGPQIATKQLQIMPPYRQQWIEFSYKGTDLGVWIEKSEEGGWDCVAYTSFIEPYDMISATRWLLDSEGRIQDVVWDEKWEQHMDGLLRDEAIDDAFVENAMWLTSATTGTALYSFSILHSKGCKLEKREYTPSIAVRHQTGVPPKPIKFSVITIPGDKITYTNKKSESLDSEDHDGVRQHLVRGNFATYTKEKPHVSGFVGQIWRGPHVRGDPAKGVFLHDCEIYKQQDEE